MKSVFRAVLVAAICCGGGVAPGLAASGPTLSSTSFVLGQPATVTTVNAGPSWTHFLLFDTATGHIPLGGGYSLGLSANFQIWAVDTVPASRTVQTTLTVPGNPALDGFTFYLQAAQINPTGTILTSTNRLDLQVSSPPKGTADWFCTPTTVTNLANGVVTSTANPIEWALGQSQPGDLIEVGPGDHPKFNLDKSWVAGQAMTTVRAQVPGTKILRHNVSGSSTIAVKKAGYVSIEGFTIEASDEAAVLCSRQQTTGHKSVHFIDCTIDGGYDWYSQSGYNSKWGVLGWDFDDFVWRGGAVQNIKREHAFYLHNCKGDVTIENVDIQHVGRTAFQLTARTWEGAEGAGKITLRDVRITDVALGDGWAGGSAITIAGRHRGAILLDAVTFRAGFDAALNAVAGFTIGTGAFVSHYGDGSANTPNGPITVQNCSLEMAAGAGDRDHVQVDATDGFTLVNSLITAGKRQALWIQHHDSYPLTLDHQATVNGSCTYDGKKYTTYQQMLSAEGL